MLLRVSTRRLRRASVRYRSDWWHLPFVRPLATASHYDRSPLRHDTPLSPRGFIETLLQKPNEHLRSTVPMTEEQLEKIGRREILVSRDYYQKFSHSVVLRDFKANKDIAQKMFDMPFDLTSTRPYKQHEIGSLVEIYSPQGKLSFGVVIRSIADVFEEEDDTLEVFTIDGDFITARPSDVTFYITKFFNAEHLQDLLNQKDAPKLLQQVQYSMVLFIHHAMDLNAALIKEDIYTAAYMKFSSNSVLRSTSNEKFYHFLRDSTRSLRKRFFTEPALYFLTHYHSVNNPYHFIVHTPLESSEIFALPRRVSENIVKASQLKANKIREFRDFLLYIYRDTEVTRKIGQNIRNLLYYSGNEYYMVFAFLKYYLKHPHPFLRPFVIELLGLEDASPTKIQQFFEGLFLYDTLVTDKLLSTEIYGFDQWSLSISDAKQILPNDDYELAHFSDVKDSKKTNTFTFKDNFKHLRLDRGSKDDLKVYGIPFGNQDGQCEVCFSISKKTSTDWVVNLHIPDVGSSISPKSNLFSKISKRPFSSDLNLPSGNLSLLPAAMKQRFSFGRGKANCITISFPYNPMDPWKNLKNLVPSVKLGVIDKVTMITEWKSTYAPKGFETLPFSERLRTGNDKVIEDFVDIMTNKMRLRIFSTLHTNFPSQILQLNENGTIDFENCYPGFHTMFEEEVHFLINSLIGKYGELHEIPLYYRTQCVSESKPGSIPETRLEEIASQRTIMQALHPSAHFKLKKLLEPEKVTISIPLNRGHIYYGIDHPVVKISSSLHAIEDLVNQWQILKHLNGWHGAENMHTANLILSGYTMENHTVIPTKPGRRPITLSSFYRNTILEKQTAASYISSRSKQYWTIKWLISHMGMVPRVYEESVGGLSAKFSSDYFPEQTKERMFFRCVVIESTSSPGLATAFCLNLGIYLNILLYPKTKVHIGDKLMCFSVVYINEIEETLIVM